jgi:hypothetical protein
MWLMSNTEALAFIAIVLRRGEGVLLSVVVKRMGESGRAGKPVQRHFCRAAVSGVTYCGTPCLLV